MALTPRSGFSNTTSGQNDIPNEIPNTQSDVLNNMPFITDTNLNKLAIDSGSYPNTTKMLVGFMKGKRVSVTYYRQLRQSASNVRTNIADYPAGRNVLDTEYQKIINLEITLPKGLDFEANPETASIGVSGEAMFYPNMNPGNGDIFMMNVGDGRIGVFQVSSVTPMSWRADRIYTVRFELQSFMDNSDSDPIEGSVTLVSVFSKANYFGGTSALLSEQTYLQLAQLTAARSNLTKFYHQTFLDTELNSYVRPDGIYDPHCVQFMANKVRMEDLHYRPKNLTGQNGVEYRKTLFGRLEDRYNNSLQGVKNQMQILAYHNTRMGVFVTELMGRYVLRPGNGDPEVLVLDQDGDILVDISAEILVDQEAQWYPYIFSGQFYLGNTNLMGPLELRVFKAVTERSVGDLTTLIAEYIDLVYTLTTAEQYYLIPIYIHFIDMALQSQYREIDAPSMSYASQGD